MKQFAKVAVLEGAFANSVWQMFSTRLFQMVSDLDEADIIVFTGGDDLNPTMYHQTALPTTHFSTPRDVAEKRIYEKYLGKKKFVGICRGAQLLNVLNGGSMWQDVDRHAGSPHKVFDKFTEEYVQVSSIHHQMMIPADNATVIATAREATYFCKADDDGKPLVIEIEPDTNRAWTDPEVLYYQKSRSLCAQYHPEVDGWQGRNYFFELIERFLQERNSLSNILTKDEDLMAKYDFNDDVPPLSCN